MNKRRRSGFSENKESGDLADVNELELAKDGDARYTFENDDKLDKNQAEQKLRVEQINSEGREFVIVNSQGEGNNQLPTAVEREKASEVLSKTSSSEKDKREQKRESSQDKPKTKVSTPQKRGGVYVAVIIICLILSVLIMLFSALREDTYVTEIVEGQIETEGADSTGEQELSRADGVLSAEQIYELGVKSAVTVKRHAQDGDAVYTGIAVLESGYIATLYEAVYDAQSIEVMSWDGSVYPAELVGGNSTANIALLKTKAALECAEIGKSSELVAGNTVYAIGNAGKGELHSSIFEGRVSYPKRLLELEAYDGTQIRAHAVQISGISDGALKGGPVFNAYGEAVGMVLASESGDAAGFCIPLDSAKAVLAQIKLGLEPSDELLRKLAFIPCSLGIIGEQTQIGDIWGVKIVGFSDDSCDAAKKLRAGDVIFRIEDKLITDTGTLREEIWSFESGESVEIFVYREEQRLSFFVVLS